MIFSKLRSEFSCSNPGRMMTSYAHITSKLLLVIALTYYNDITIVVSQSVTPNNYCATWVSPTPADNEGTLEYFSFYADQCGTKCVESQSPIPNKYGLTTFHKDGNNNAQLPIIRIGFKRRYLLIGGAKTIPNGETFTYTRQDGCQCVAKIIAQPGYGSTHKPNTNWMYLYPPMNAMDDCSNMVLTIPVG